MRCFVYFDERDFWLTLKPERVWMPSERDYLASSSVEPKQLLEWFEQRLDRVTEDEKKAALEDFAARILRLMDHPTDYFDVGNGRRNLPNDAVLTLDVPDAYFEAKGYVCCTPASGQLLEILTEAAEDSIVSCRGCGENLEPDCPSCGNCGWKNPLLAQGLI